MEGQGGWGRNWDKLLRNYSSGEDSDEYDIPNIVSFQKNCKRNAELIQSFIPHMTPEGVKCIPPMLMQDPYVMHDDLLKSGFFDSVRSGESLASDGEPSSSKSACEEEGGVSKEGEGEKEVARNLAHEEGGEEEEVARNLVAKILESATEEDALLERHVHEDCEEGVLV